MNIALIGIGGWGKDLLNVIRGLEAAGELKLTAVSDIQYEQNIDKINELKKNGVRYYRQYEELLRSEKTTDIVVIATPIHLHRPMGIAAMEAGFHVLLEKPPAVTIQDVDAIIETSERTGRHCAIDFLHASGASFLELRRNIAQGTLGRVKTITGVGLWERLDSYYTRTGWAGKLVSNGNYVLDGTVNNPLSHLLNNMLLLGQAAPNAGSTAVSKVTAELYHAHEIEGEDTSCIRVVTGNGIEHCFYATLCQDGSETPYIIVDGTDGSAYWDYSHRMQIAANGTVIERQPPDQDAWEGHKLLMANMVRNLCDVVSGRERSLYCSVQDTRSFVLASNGAFESSGGTHPIPAPYCVRSSREGSIATHIAGIKELMLDAARQHRLYAEMGVEWAVAGREMNMGDYKRFAMDFQNHS